MIIQETGTHFNSKPIEYYIDSNNCWVCTSHSNKGYGYIQTVRHGKNLLMHRYVYQLLVGAIPCGMSVLHACDARNCINPEHLFIGTSLDNMRDKITKGRAKYLRGIEHPLSRIKDEDVKNIRRMSRNGKPQVDIAITYGLSQSHISDIINKKKWRHI